MVLKQIDFAYNIKQNGHKNDQSKCWRSPVLCSPAAMQARGPSAMARQARETSAVARVHS